MPFDLPRPTEEKDVTSYTEHTKDGRRLSFRGSLFQPWCHVTAKKEIGRRRAIDRTRAEADFRRAAPAPTGRQVAAAEG